jgi:predicted thioesterase
MAELEIGLKGYKEMIVVREDLASFTGNIGAEVLSTHRVVLLMEQAAREAIKGRLPEGTITVGTMIQMRHFAASPLGSKVRAEAVLKDVEGRRLLFHVVVEDDMEKIAEGENERYIVSEQKFLQRLRRKAKG